MELGGPVALKAVSPLLLHKTEAHAVQLGLSGSRQVRTAAARMAKAVADQGHPVDRFLVQGMVGGGVELLVGVVHDALFGPVVACGAGGTAVELLKDVAVRLAPLTDRDAAEMVRSLATFPLLDGYRGAPKADVAALEDLLLRVSALVEAHPRSPSWTATRSRRCQTGSSWSTPGSGSRRPACRCRWPPAAGSG